MMPKLTQSPTIAERITAASIIQAIGPQKCDRNCMIGLTVVSGNSL